MERLNEKVAAILDEIADLLDLKEDSFFKTRAYRKAAREIESSREDIKELYIRGRLDSIPGIGKAIHDKVVEIIRTGELQYLNELRQEFPAGLMQIMDVPEIGPRTAARLYKDLKVTNLADLKLAAEQHRIRRLKGFGEKTEENILRGIVYLESRRGRMLLGYAYPRGTALERHMRLNGFGMVSLGGSLRRMKETIGDIDLLVGTEDAGRAMDVFVAYPQVKEVLLRGETKTSIRLMDGVQVDLRVVAPESYGAALQYFTGSKEHNVVLRSMAIDMGLKINEYGVFRKDDGTRVAGETEEGVYDALGLRMMPPEMREDRGEIDLAKRGSLPKILDIADIKGDLHIHTEASDGMESMEAMIEAARGKGYQYLAITDHSVSLKVANGLSVERLEESIRKVRELDRVYDDIRVLIGAEVDIDERGDLDYPKETLEQLDVVIAAVHSRFRMPAGEMTDRLLTAISNENVDILAHPTGRTIQMREPCEFDLSKVMEEAKGNRVCLEVNSFPERLDLNDRNCMMAMEKGVGLAIGTDAHNIRQLDYMFFGVATARRGWVTPDRVLNALPLKDLEKRLGI